METIANIVKEENRTTMQSPMYSSWQSVVFPHTALAYRVHPEIKYLAANSYARFEKAQAISRGEKETNHSKLLSKYQSMSVEYITNITSVSNEVVDAAYYRQYEHSDGTKFHLKIKKGFRIKLAFISAGMTTKAMTYLVQDMFNFFDRKAFEVHVFATTPPDPPFFINTVMRGVDWREKIKDSAEHFHDVSGKSRAVVIKKIKKLGIHILVNWDGYAQNGAKVEGLFGLRPAPVQVSHMVI